MGKKEAHLTLRMVTGFCKLRNALSASKVHDFRSLPLSHLLLHNLKSGSGGQEKFCRVFVELLGDATGDFYLFFLRSPEKLSLCGIPVFFR